MRISDWSSDVCSNDLVTIADEAAERALAARLPALVPGSVLVGEEGVERDAGLLGLLQGDAPVWIVDPIDGTKNRSEEHTSELQSLMRISYAVFCLKKKNKTERYSITNISH